MPVEAKNNKMRLLVGANEAVPMIISGAWGGFEKTDRSFSFQYLHVFFYRSFHLKYTSDIIIFIYF